MVFSPPGADERIVAAAAEDVLDIANDIDPEDTERLRSRPVEIAGHPGGVGDTLARTIGVENREVNEVLAVAAVEDVVALVVEDLVGAVAAVDEIPAVAADEDVVALAAHDDVIAGAAAGDSH